MPPTVVKSHSDPTLHSGIENGDALNLLRALHARMDKLEESLERLNSATAQVPGLMAIGVDAADEVVQKMQDRDIDLEIRLQNAARLLDIATNSSTVRQVESMVKMSEQLPGLLSIAIDSVDEMAKDLDLSSIVNTADDAREALAKTKNEPATRIKGLFSIMRALKDPDRQRGLAFLLDFLKNFGKQLTNEH